MTTKKRRHWTAEKKLQIIEEARQTRQTVSGVCRHHGIATGQFYTWEKRARQGALEALRARKRGRKSRNREARLKTEVTRLRAVVAELSAENLELKRALAIAPHRRYSAEEKAVLLETVRQTQARTGESVEVILAQLGFPPATYYRWQARERENRLADAIVVPRRRVPVPTPEEVESVRDFALAYPQMGYKRLTWAMVDEDVAYLRPWQVYDILGKHDLLRRITQPASKPLKRPLEPDHPDQVWHVDLMYLYIEPRWYYLVDILDGYSRFLVHWSLNLTMLADIVTLTVQEALEKLPHRRPGEPRIVHDNGGQFLSTEWRRFVEGAGVTDIRTRVAHPQSNGRLERLHRTHREEGLTEEDLGDYYRALEGMDRWSHYYNYKRPHSALKCLRPVDYYRGDPAARLAEREQKLVRALEARGQYWQAYGNVKELQNLSLNWTLDKCK